MTSQDPSSVKCDSPGDGKKPACCFFRAEILREREGSAFAPRPAVRAHRLVRDMITPQMLDFDTALALYEWQREMGADEPVGEEPVNRYELVAEAVKVAPRMAEPAPPPVAPVATGSAADRKSVV